MYQEHNNLHHYMKEESGKRIVSDILDKERPGWTSAYFNVYFEVKVPDFITGRYRKIDVVYIIHPSGRDKRPVTIAFELKSFRQDLLKDAKMERYLGFTDYFLICQKRYNHVTDALWRAQFQQQIGVCSIRHGEIVKFPKKQYVDKRYRWALIDSLQSYIASNRPVFRCEVSNGEIQPSSMWMKHYLKSDWGKMFQFSRERLDEFVVSTYGNYKEIKDVPFLQNHFPINRGIACN